MSESPDVIWLSGSPSLQYLDRPLIKFLARQVSVAHWQYYQEKDEGSSLDNAVVLLHEYLGTRQDPVHLIGHGLSGVIGLLYARKYPEKVRSLTLLSVAAQPSMGWQSYYYVQRHLLPCSRQQLLAMIVTTLFGPHLPYPAKDLIKSLSKDLEESPCLHSLFSLVELSAGGIKPPLMVCGSQTDPIIHPKVLHEWKSWLKPEDVLWDDPEGRHFFHYFNPHPVGQRILQFWQSKKSAMYANNFTTEEYESAHHS